VVLILIERHTIVAFASIVIVRWIYVVTKNIKKKTILTTPRRSRLAFFLLLLTSENL
jgi:hypothetical protein